MKEFDAFVNNVISKSSNNIHTDTETYVFMYSGI